MVWTTSGRSCPVHRVAGLRFRGVGAVGVVRQPVPVSSDICGPPLGAGLLVLGDRLGATLDSHHLGLRSLDLAHQRLLGIMCCVACLVGLVGLVGVRAPERRRRPGDRHGRRVGGRGVLLELDEHRRGVLDDLRVVDTDAVQEPPGERELSREEGP